MDPHTLTETLDLCKNPTGPFENAFGKIQSIDVPNKQIEVVYDDGEVAKWMVNNPKTLPDLQKGMNVFIETTSTQDRSANFYAIAKPARFDPM